MSATLEVTILGSGSSGGVPRADGNWGVCNPADPRNNRTRCSMMLRRPSGEGPERWTTLVVDAAPEFRQQTAAGTRSRGEEVGVRHARVHNDAGRRSLRAFEPPFQLESEEQIRQLAAPVRRPRNVAALPLQVAEVHGRAAMRNGADGDDAGGRGFRLIAGTEQRGQQQPGEREVAEVIRAELQLESLRRGAALRQGHDAGIVDEQIEAPAGGKERSGGGAD